MSNDPNMAVNGKGQDPMVLAQNTHRVAVNLLVLLDIGLFPGKHSLGIEECKGFVRAILEDAAQKMQPQMVPSPPAA